MKPIYTTILSLVFSFFFVLSNALAEDKTEVIIIEQPRDVIECEGSIDQYLYVVAAPAHRGYKVLYRWWKDGRPYSNWVEDFGQLTFDALKYSMSGEYRAELFAFDPNWTSAFGNPFSYDSARVSPIILSEPTNLYVLQKPSFIDTIPLVIAKKGSDVVITFDANIYGEHNMENPTYWTDIQWYKDSIALIDGERISGVKSSILTIDNIIESDYNEKYRVRLIGECDTIWSNEFGIYDEPRVIAYYWSAIISGCLKDTVSIFTRSKSSVPGIDIKHQWLINDEPLEDIEGIVTGSTTEELTFILDTNNTFNYLSDFKLLSWPNGYKHNLDTMYKTSPQRRLSYLPLPFILNKLDSVYKVKIGDVLKLPLKLKSKTLFIRWFRNDKELFQNIDTLSLGILDESFAGEYKAIAYNDCSEDTSNLAIVEIEKNPEVITGINSEEQFEFIKLYPNPVYSETTISWNVDTPGFANIYFTDNLGNKVHTALSKYIETGFSNLLIDTKKLNLSSGAYYLHFIKNNLHKTIQFIVIE